jgi:uncharacterized protein (UPF0335 family)
MATNAIASDELRLLIERIERLEEEKKGIADDIRCVYAEAKSRGFDPKTMRAIVKLRGMDTHTRREAEALLDTYKAALGMLDGTPLGRWALERLEKDDEKDKPADADAGDDAADESDDAPEVPPAEPEPDVDEAKAQGAAAARDGKPVTSNPFPARDIRRAAWDEAWCAALGSDGMDIPDALKPKPKPKKSKSAEGAEDESSPE